MGDKYYFIITWVTMHLLLKQNVGKAELEACSSLLAPNLFSNLGILPPTD